MTTQSNVQGVWFWDTFPKICTWLLIPWLVAFFGIAIFNHEWLNAFLTGSNYLALLSGLIIAVGAIGNIVPGIPTNAMPLTFGLMVGANLLPAQTASFWSLSACIFGSWIGFEFGNFIPDLGSLERSKRFADTLDSVRNKRYKEVFFTRFGPKAAVLGHANFAAGRLRLSFLPFILACIPGHIIWLLTYGIPAYLVGRYLHL